MREVILSAVLIFCAACGVARQPEAARSVAAYEISLPREEDRTELLAMLDLQARTEGLHLDVASPSALAASARAIPDARTTIQAAIWRGKDDDQLEASIADIGQPGRVWIVFLKGEDPNVAKPFRERLMQRIVARWPGTTSLPIMPTGAIPLPNDLRRTNHGYEVDPSAAHKYQMSR